MQSASNQRIDFVHGLRGIACLIVLIAHLGLLAGAFPAFTAALVGLDPPLAPAPSKFMMNVAKDLPINLGAFGVAIFFLISGLVIPISLEKSNRGSFLIARFFRLVPTYAVCLGLTLAGLWLIRVHFGKPGGKFPWTAALEQVLFVRDLLWKPPLDGIVWTLEVEAKFYLACALLLPLLRARDVSGILLINACAVGLALFVGTVPVEIVLQNKRLYGFLNALFFGSTYLSFMWIGAIFYFRWKGDITARTAITAILLLNAMFAVHVLYGPATRVDKRITLITYESALAVFWLTYKFPAWCSRRRLLDRLGDISYPLYAIHSFLGYGLIVLLHQSGMNRYVAMIAVIGLMILAATVVHRLVETPTQRFGRWLGNRVQRLGAKPSVAVLPWPQSSSRAA